MTAADTDAILAKRAEIEAEAAGRTLVDALAATVATYGPEPAYSDRHVAPGAPEDQTWRTLTWNETCELGHDVAAGLIDLGVAAGDHVAIMATNRIEHVVADIGIVHAAATPMSIYNTLSVERVGFVAGQSEPTVAILENADHLQRWSAAIEASTRLLAVVIDPDACPDGERYLTWDALVAAGRERRAAHPDEVAVLTLDGEVATVVAERLGVEFTGLVDLAQKPEILTMAQAAVDAANERLSRPEQVKAFELLPTEWTAESEELTPTLKLKRRVVNTKYSDVVDRLYG